MIKISELYKELKKILYPCYETTRKDEVIVRCPFCGDSKKNRNSAHLYIKSTPPYYFFCQRCTSFGTLDSNMMLNALKVNNFALINSIEQNRKAYNKKLTRKYGFNIKDKPIYFNKVIKDKNDEDKIKYVENRLGISISEEDIERYKIVFNFKRFLDLNKIDVKKIFDFNYKRQIELYNKLNNFCVGFLSYDKNLIVFRSLDVNKTNFRYYNLLLVKEMQSSKYFSIKNDIYGGIEKTNIIITEGIFDILGVFNHVYDKKLDSNIYFSANGKNFNNLLNSIAKLGFLNSDIYIYSDFEVKQKYYADLKNMNILSKLNGLNIVYNKKSKDCGVTKDKIELTSPILI